MVKISPSILAGDFLHLNEEIKLMEKAEVDSIHFDIMDGIYVPNITFGYKFLSSIKKTTSLPADVHLMIAHPQRYIKDFIDAGANILTFHYETVHFPLRIIDNIKMLNCKAGIAINPSTPVNILKDVICYLDVVLLMSVEPGFHGQDFIDTSYGRIKELKDLITSANSKTLIEVDGGIGLDNYKQLIDIGTDIFVIGNAFFKQKDYKKFVNTIKKYGK